MSLKIIQQFFKKPWLYLGIAIIGIVLKFYGIENKYFWRDEISTIYHTSGNQIFDIAANEIQNISYYTDQLHLKNKDLSLWSQLKGLYGSPNLNPLHYSFLMIWYRVAGDDVMYYRFFNIFILLLTLPMLFLLAKKLFNSNLAGWIAISLFVFSPYFHHYTHEARYNILLAFLIITFHYLFLLAVSHNKLKWWILYSLTGILALYASVLSGLIVFGHFIYILFFKKAVRIAYSFNLIIILLCYVPWVLSMINNKDEIFSSLAWHSYFGTTQNPLKLLLVQFVGFTQFFEYFGTTTQHFNYLMLFNFKGNYWYIAIDAIVLILIITSFIYTIKKAPREISTYLLSIVLPFILFFLITDLVRKTDGSIFERYQAINFIGISLFVVYLFQRKILTGKLLYTSIYAGLIIIGFISINRITQDRCWKIGPACPERIATAQFFSNARNPLLITDCSGAFAGKESIYALMNECSSENIEILFASPDIENVKGLLRDKNFSEIYVTLSSDTLIQNLKSQFGEKIHLLEIEGILPVWQINLNEIDKI